MILAIESSCDETCVALVERDGDSVKVFRSLTSSSAQIQAKYGGVVPEVAAREQVRSIIPVLTELTQDVDLALIESIAVSSGPGLMGSLLVGVETAKSLSWAWNKPLYGVNHLVAHLMACFIKQESDDWSPPRLPAIGVVISGGHTDIIYMKNMTDWTWVGGTRDDAVGEAFDKSAVLLGLPYPGGPSIQEAIENYNSGKTRMEVAKLPRPMIREKNLEMSFSGLKAAIYKELFGKNLSNSEKGAWAREFNEAVADVLEKKIELAIEKYEVESVLIAGGVAANKMIRMRLLALGAKMSVKMHIPEIKYCGDNAGMIGAGALMRPDIQKDVVADPSLTVA
jgi:N6-L-threonylcarbamoyladenine synthase